MACALLTPLPLEAQDARRARPSSGSFAAPAAVPSVPSVRTTVTGLALLGGSALAGARVETSHGAVGSTAPDGSFALSTEVAAGRRLVVRVEIVRKGQSLAGESLSVPVAAGGITDVGTIALAPGPSGPLFPGSQHFLRVNQSSVASADLDGDDDRDLVVVSDSGAGFAGVLLNHGDATFASAVSYPLGSNPLWVTTGDLDGDLDVDLVVANSGSPFLGIQSTVSVLRNDGDGTFAPAVKLEVGIADSLVETVDLDGDGDLDFVVGNSRSSSTDVELSLLFNAGDGTFAAPIDYVVGEFEFFVPGDVDADGDVDLVLLGDPSVVVVWRNDGQGGLTADGSFATGAGAADELAIGDLDGDRDLDLAVASREGFAPSHANLTVLLNDGTGAFASPVHQATLADVERMTAADLDGDGALDLAISTEEREILVLSNLGAGSFAPALPYETALSATSLVAGDLDGDAEVDLAVGTSSDRVTILLNDHERRLEAQLSFAADSPAGVLPVNVDGDAELELVFANFDSASVSVLERESDGSFAPAVTYATGSLPLHVAASDLDGDGDRDLGVVNHGDGSVSILPSQGDGTFAPHLAYATGAEPMVLALGDLDGDGAVDLAVARRSPSGVALLLNDGAGAFGPRVEYPAGFLTTDVALGDLDRDGDLDCAVSTSNAGTVVGTFTVLLNQGDGTLAPPVRYGAGSSEAVAVGDLDQDGDLDVVTTGAFQPSFVYHNQSAATYAPGLPLALVRGGRDVATVDLDGDGDLEIALTTDVSSFVAVLPNTGDGTFGTPPEYFATAIASLSLGIGDLDGDRDLDLVTGGRSSVSPGAISVLWNRTRRLPRVVDPVADELVIDVMR